MDISLSPRPDATGALGRLESVLAPLSPRVVACSGGIDSLVLATVAHRGAPTTTVVAHTVTPAVPGDGTSRVHQFAATEGWELRIVTSHEFDDEQYLRNPRDRCYHCKRNLYDALALVAGETGGGDATLLSGANVDDLGEYRPGLDAAAERAVRHPYVEAGIGKSEIRAIARRLRLPIADLAASPCLASRLYTGTRVTASRVRAVEAGEAELRARTGLDVVRCRVREDQVLIEVAAGHRDRVTPEHRRAVLATMAAIEPSLVAAELDRAPYRPGRAILD